MSECLRHSSICCSLRMSHSYELMNEHRIPIGTKLEHTIGTICPRSPVNFKCLLSSSSRYGMMTCVPILPISRFRNISHKTPKSSLQLTQFRNDISPKESRAPKHSHDMSADGTVSRNTRRDDRFVGDWCDEIMNCTLVPDGIGIKSEKSKT
jgi:hypothetical protein